MQPTIHLAISAVGGGSVWAVTGEPLALPVAVAAGVAIDVDYLLYRFPMAIKLLHGWEWFAALLAAGILTGFPWWVTAAAVAYGLHIAGDQMVHRRGRWWYFLTYRTWQRYRRRKLMGTAHWNLQRG